MKRRVRVLACAAGLLAGALTLPHPAAGFAPRDEAGTLVIKTVPPTPGARFSADGVIARADRAGVARLPVRKFTGLEQRFNVLTTKVQKDQTVLRDRIMGTPEHGAGGRPLVVGLRTQRLVKWGFVDRGGKEVPTERVTRLVLKSNTGEVLALTGADLTRPRWVAASRTQQTPAGLVSKDLYWSVTQVVIDGAEVVNKGQQVFVPNETRRWTVEVLFYRVQVVGRDLLFGQKVGRHVELHRPDGEVVRAPLAGGEAVLPEVPRGQYELRVSGSGMSFLRPASISKDQTLEIQVITPLNLTLIGSALFLIALSLILVGRRHHVFTFGRQLGRIVARRRAHASLRRQQAHGSARRRRVVVAARRTLLVAALAAAAAVAVLLAPPRASADPSGPGSGGSPAPVLAYYYIWYNPTSWQRAKSDYPLLGRYSSDDAEVMRRHVKMARSAGITGFLVSWKHTDVLDPRLEQLVETARSQDFKLGIVYQGLDFARRTLPVERVAEDLQYLADQYGDDPVLDIFGKPVVILTGSEDYTVDQLRRIVEPVRGRLLVLGAAKSVEDYQRVAPVLDGDAYYWSSGDPSLPSYTERLRSIGATVHAHGGLWLAPAAPGFDARLIGGRQVIPRRDGETLRLSMDAARDSAPDAVAVISWNEFSENSHLEPSEENGTVALRTLADILGAKVEIHVPQDSSDVTSQRPGLTGWGAVVTIALLTGLLNLALLLRRQRREPALPPLRGGAPRGGVR
jgi:hypothetical protein